MSKPEVVEKVPVSLSEMKVELQAIQKRDSELGFRAGKTMEYVNSVATISKSAYLKLKSELEGLKIPRLKDEHVVKIIDLMPTHVNELSVILSGYTLTVSKENMAKIVKVIQGSGLKN